MNNNPGPGREAINDRISSVKDIDGLKELLKDLVRSTKFHSEESGSGGAQTIRLSSDNPTGAGSLVRNTVPVGPKTGSYAPATPAEFAATLGGVVNQNVSGALVAPATPSASGTQTPTITPILRGFPNYQFAPTTGHETLDNPEYSNQISQQEVVLQVQMGDKVKYARLPLHDTPDVGVPRPLLGAAQAPAIPTVWYNSVYYIPGNRVNVGGVLYQCTAANTSQTPPNATYWAVVSAADQTQEIARTLNALTQMHNDLVQSVLTMGLLRPVTRENDKIDFTVPPPS